MVDAGESSSLSMLVALRVLTGVNGKILGWTLLVRGQKRKNIFGEGFLLRGVLRFWARAAQRDRVKVGGADDRRKCKAWR
jgi:hypothetical protein